jgi:type IV pilus assembly protein PilC
MAVFSYKAKDSNGKIKNGKFDVENKDELEKKLSSLGLSVIFYKEEKSKKSNIEVSKILKRVSVIDKMLFTRHLGVMLKAGLPFSRSIAVLSEQTNNLYFAEILQSVQEDIQKGNSLADSLAKYPKVFDNLFVSMIRVGEIGGNLEEVLNILYIQLKKEHELVSRIKGAMMYPAVIIFAMVVIGTLMMIYVVPSLLNIFVEMEVELPLSTKIIVFVSNTLQDYGIFVFLGFAILLGSFFWCIKTPKGKKSFDYFLLRLPTISGIIAKVNMARFSRTLSSMIASGIPIVEALKIISKTLGNTYYRESVEDACQYVQKGIELSEVIGKHDKLYHPLMMHMIEVGEETGTLEDTLKQIAEFYEEEIEQITANLSSIIEPILMLVIGGAVGFFAISMIQPMYGIMGHM